MERELVWRPDPPPDADDLAGELLAGLAGLADATPPAPAADGMPDELRARLAVAEPNRILEHRDDGTLLRISFPARGTVDAVDVHVEGDADWGVALRDLRRVCDDALIDAASGRPWPG